jgi:hypothetical protein
VTERDAGAYGYLSIADVSDPLSVEILAAIPVCGLAYGITVVGDHAYTPSSHYGLCVIDVTDPTAPEQIGHVATSPGGIYGGIVISEGVAYVGGVDAGLIVIDVSVPTAPYVLGQLNTPGSAGGVAVSGDHVLIADQSAGLQVMLRQCAASGIAEGETSPPGSPWMSLSPNPSRSSVTIRFDLRSETATGLEIFDPTGRRVRRLRVGHFGSGYRELTWDGRDEAGRSLANGMYFVRITGPGDDVTRGVALLR